MAALVGKARLGEALLGIPRDAADADVAAFVDQLIAKFNADQPRNDQGEWTDGGGTVRDRPSTRESISHPALAHNQKADPGAAGAFTPIVMTGKQGAGYGTAPREWAKESSLSRNPKTGKDEPVTPESIRRNLDHWFDQATREDVQNGLTWYSRALDFSHDLYQRKGAEVGLSLDEVVGIVAATSIQNMWDDNYGTPNALQGRGNQRMAEKLLDILKENKPITITRDEARAWKAETGQNISRYVGSTPIRDLPSNLAVAFVDQLPNPAFGTRKNATETLTPWGGLSIGAEKAFKIYQGTGIPDALGESGFKIRSFYRNIRTAQSGVDDKDVTIDSWMLRVSTNRVATGTNKEIDHTADRQNSLISTKGKYTRLADIVRDAAKARGMTPKQYQAVVWIRYHRDGIKIQQVNKLAQNAAKRALEADKKTRAMGRGRRVNASLSLYVSKMFDEFLPPDGFEPTDGQAMAQAVEDEFFFRLLAHLRGHSTEVWDDTWGPWDDRDDAILDQMLGGE